jgi:hypothetical protein
LQNQGLSWDRRDSEFMRKEESKHADANFGAGLLAGKSRSRSGLLIRNRNEKQN